jgi:hypothetical protein
MADSVESSEFDLDVFISYSHDSDPHKKWVKKLADDLVLNGINVRMDEYDTTPGDDIVSYMAKSVREAQKVLMICSETYVKKANDGKGGVGFEVMIVSGELVKDLGTSKFIPIIRQEDGATDVPTFVSTRLYINFSENLPYDESFHKLLKAIGSIPTIKKPQKGKYPYGSDTAKSREYSIELSIPEKPTQEQLKLFYEQAKDIAEAGKMGLWRDIVQKSRRDYKTELDKWFAKWSSVLPQDEKLPEIAMEAIEIYEPLYVVEIAGLASYNPDFQKQTSVINDIMNGVEFLRSGYLAYANIQEAIAYVFQGIYGAMCLAIDRADIVFDLVHAVIQVKGIRKEIWKHSDIVGSPYSLGNGGWELLKTLPNKWVWLEYAFSNNKEYTVSLVAYTMLLNIIDFLDTVKHHIALFEKKEFYPERLYLRSTFREFANPGYNRLMKNKLLFRRVLSELSLEVDELTGLWEVWWQRNTNIDRNGLRFTHDDDMFRMLIKDVYDLE